MKDSTAPEQPNAVKILQTIFTMAVSSTSVNRASGPTIAYFGPIKAALGGNVMLKFSLSVAALIVLGSAAYAADARGDFIAT